MPQNPVGWWLQFYHANFYGFIPNFLVQEGTIITRETPINEPAWENTTFWALLNPTVHFWMLVFHCVLVAQKPGYVSDLARSRHWAQPTEPQPVRLRVGTEHFGIGPPIDPLIYWWTPWFPVDFPWFSLKSIRQMLSKKHETQLHTIAAMNLGLHPPLS
jgi:hypothetical protein